MGQFKALNVGWVITELVCPGLHWDCHSQMRVQTRYSKHTATERSLSHAWWRVASGLPLWQPTIESVFPRPLRFGGWLSCAQVARATSPRKGINSPLRWMVREGTSSQVLKCTGYRGPDFPWSPEVTQAQISTQTLTEIRSWTQVWLSVNIQPKTSLLPGVATSTLKWIWAQWQYGLQTST